MTCAYAEHVRWDMPTWLPSQFLLLLLGAPSSSFCHDLAEASPKCTEDRCYIQYGIANVQFLSIGDDMNWDDRWWHVHTQSMLGETCLHGCPVSFFCFCWVLSSSFCHDLVEASPKCTEDRCYIQYGMANVQFLSIGDDMNWDDRWWHVHTQSMLVETCLHGCPVNFFCFCWVLRLRAFVMILQKSLQNAIKTDVGSSVVYQMLGVQSGVEVILLSV